MSLIEKFVRRKEKFTDSTNVLPSIPPDGTNHVDEASSWDLAKDIYKGEIFINLPQGILYTSDGNSIIEINREEGIASGLELEFGPSPLYFVVTSGFLRSSNRRYYYTSNGSSDVQINNNLSVYPRIDLVIGSTTTTRNPDDSLALSLSVVEGTPDIDPQIPATPANKYLIGLIYVPGAYTSGSDAVNPLPISESDPSDYIEKFLKQSNKWESGRMYLKDQFVYDASGVYLVLKNYYSGTSVSNDVSNNFLLSIGGSGSGGGDGSFGDDDILGSNRHTIAIGENLTLGALYQHYIKGTFDVLGTFNIEPGGQLVIDAEDQFTLPTLPIPQIWVKGRKIQPKRIEYSDAADFMANYNRAAGNEPIQIGLFYLDSGERAWMELPELRYELLVVNKNSISRYPHTVSTEKTQRSKGKTLSHPANDVALYSTTNSTIFSQANDSVLGRKTEWIPNTNANFPNNRGRNVITNVEINPTFWFKNLSTSPRYGEEIMPMLELDFDTVMRVKGSGNKGTNKSISFAFRLSAADPNSFNISKNRYDNRIYSEVSEIYTLLPKCINFPDPGNPAIIERVYYDWIFTK